jgi:dTDP-glucose pyrophosphorylase
LLPSEATIKDAIKSLNDSALQIALVVTQYNTLLGTLTDGDIRRGLLKGMDLDDSITPIIKEDPLVVPPQMDRRTALQIMQTNNIRQLPVVNENREIVDLYLLRDLLKPATRTNTMVIMAGGEGSRLRPHTENCPKPLLPICGKPILEHIIDRAKKDGISHFIFAVHYLGHMIEEHFGNGENWNIKIDYLYEETPLGTAGALSLLIPRPSSAFLVTNGDVLTDIRYGEIIDFHARFKAAATMAVRLHEWQHPYGVVHTRGMDIIGFNEKPVYRTHVNAGVYVLDPLMLNLLKTNQYCEMPSLFERIQKEGKRTVAYPMHEPWIDVGRQSDFERAEEYVNQSQNNQMKIHKNENLP